MKITLRKAADRGISRFDWLDSRHRHPPQRIQCIKSRAGAEYKKLIAAVPSEEATLDKSKNLASLCVWYGPDLIARRFDRTRNTAWDERNDEAPLSGSSDAVSTGGEPGSQNPVKNAADKAKTAVRGIFGR